MALDDLRDPPAGPHPGTAALDPGPDYPHEPRLSDPAHRDQDGPAWHQGRFAERVRRQWNGVDLHGALDMADLDAVADAVHHRVGGDRDEIRGRLADLAALDAFAEPPQADPLVKPGEPV